MKARKNNHSAWRIWRWLLAIVGGYYFILWLGLGHKTIGSPKQMGKAQVVRGEKIEPVKPSPTNPVPPVSAMAVLSNAVAVSATNPPPNAPGGFNPTRPGQAPPRAPNIPLPTPGMIGDASVLRRAVPTSADFNTLPDVIEQ